MHNGIALCVPGSSLMLKRQAGRQASTGPAENGPFSQRFPMFVPSLSWQTFGVY